MQTNIFSRNSRKTRKYFIAIFREFCVFREKHTHDLPAVGRPA
jgi:hypothetical protein